MLKIEILNKDKNVIFEASGQSIDCVYNGQYNEGDRIVIHKKDMEFVSVQLGETLAESIIYAPSSSVEFEIPMGNLRRGYDEKAFQGDAHKISVKETDENEAYGFRNIALNSHDVRGKKKYYPHAYANLVTREDVCFFERNAIDGICCNDGHGEYPYHSWAGGAREGTWNIIWTSERKLRSKNSCSI